MGKNRYEHQLDARGRLGQLWSSPLYPKAPPFVNGILIPPKNPKMLSESIDKIYKNKNNRGKKNIDQIGRFKDFCRLLNIDL